MVCASHQPQRTMESTNQPATGATWITVAVEGTLGRAIKYGLAKVRRAHHPEPGAEAARDL